ncbi:MAG: inorganic diphosphatase [Clostridia bacterium]|nr:inorganic diphosphatase [Clostridia bacterium]
MNIWHDISRNRIKADDFIAVIEIVKGSKKKYELDKETGLIRLDRVLYTSTHYPANYGLIPRTYADDDDPLDVLVICSEPLDPLILVRCYPIGVTTMVDNNEKDEKIIAVPYSDPMYNCYKDITDLPTHVFDEIKHFFLTYKQLEGKATVVDEVQNAEVARQVIQRAMDRYDEAFREHFKYNA